MKLDSEPSADSTVSWRASARRSGGKDAVAWVQPAELAKVGTLLVLAKYLSKESRNLDNFREIALAFFLVFLPLVLVMKQPDLGSALVFLALILPVLHWAGLSSMVLFVLIAPLLI